LKFENNDITGVPMLPVSYMNARCKGEVRIASAYNSVHESTQKLFQHPEHCPREFLDPEFTFPFELVLSWKTVNTRKYRIGDLL
jgi:hypothetical protein